MPDSLETDSVRRSRPAFKSDAGRIVYGGGAITPDIIVRPDTLTTPADSPPELFFRLWPAVLVRVLAAEHLEQRRLRILGADDCIDTVGEYDRTRELPVSTVAVAETKRSL